MDRILFQQKKLLRTNSKVDLYSFMIFPQNHKKPLRKPNMTENQKHPTEPFRQNRTSGSNLGSKILKNCTLYSSHQPPRKKKKTWLVQLFFHIHNFPTSPNLPPSKKKVGRKNFSAESCLQRQLRRPLQGNINDRNLPSPGTRWDRLKVLDWRDLERWRFIGVPQKKKTLKKKGTHVGVISM